MKSTMTHTYHRLNRFVMRKRPTYITRILAAMQPNTRTKDQVPCLPQGVTKWGLH